MRLFALLILLFGIAQTSAFSVPGGYERVLLYYLYSIDAQLNGGKPQKIATGCSKSSTPCTLDQLLRYIAKNPSNLPQAAPATRYPELPPMDDTARALATKDANNFDFAGQIITGRALPGASNDYSKFLTQLGELAASFARRSPENANLLKINLQAIRNARRNAQLTTFEAVKDNAGITVATNEIPLYDGADENHKALIIDAQKTLTDNPGLTLRDLKTRWMANTEGGHDNNVDSLKLTLDDWDKKC
ncbi:uncharacterized protein BHQ10_003862 [Talaromyces amestolkiae]|uniref:Uncharacterized protein n=1 Tax=Talaromyces amestolkiae TaxID=1196081 RepID=A0A364KWC4_TALAM|nr:uncharacterized protein BHQ10_003862 [Talaromyces amestolkiae]RAO67850.1 hypothetical protein BHQ10_003862 [Talaromyces amestolkiae]